MISLEVLQVIDSIDRKGSFSAAADELFRVPSALTYTVKKAEEHLKIKLFDRDRQRARLTPAGKLLLEEGREVLAQLQRLEEQVKRVDDGWETQLRIAVDTILPAEPLLPLIRELQADHPWLNIQLLEEALSGSWEALVNQRADLVIGLSGDISGSQWDKILLGQTTMGLYCGATHPAANLATLTQASVLDDFTHIVIRDSARQLAPRNVGLLGLKQEMTVPSMQHKLAALLANIGISHLPHTIAAPYLATGQLKALALSQGQHTGAFFMAWPKDNTGKANDCLRKMIIERGVYREVLS